MADIHDGKFVVKDKSHIPRINPDEADGSVNPALYDAEGYLISMQYRLDGDSQDQGEEIGKKDAILGMTNHQKRILRDSMKHMRVIDPGQTDKFEGDLLMWMLEHIPTMLSTFPSFKKHAKIIKPGDKPKSLEELRKKPDFVEHAHKLVQALDDLINLSLTDPKKFSAKLEYIGKLHVTNKIRVSSDSFKVLEENFFEFQAKYFDVKKNSEEHLLWKEFLHVLYTHVQQAEMKYPLKSKLCCEVM